MTNHETIVSFRVRAASWIDRHLPAWGDDQVDSRELQCLMFEHGFAGIAFPAEYGGAGLTLEHQKAFFDIAAALDRQVPTTNSVSIGMLGPTILDHGSQEAKLRFLPPLLRGDELWIQLLSEPRGGSDMAGSITRLTRDGDTYILNGSKMWSSGAHESDYGLCLCRSDWDVPKHHGLSMIAVPLRHTRGIAIQQTRSATGELGQFCEEFFDDVMLPLDNLIGAENQGWAVAQTLLLHERNAVGNIGYGYLNGCRTRGPKRMFALQPAGQLAARARVRGVLPAVSGMIADTYIDSVVGPLTSARVTTGLRIGTHSGPWGSLAKLQSTVSAQASVRTALAAFGAEAVIWDGDNVQLDNIGTTWLESRGGTIAGGSNEMQRNIISERLLGLPREPTADRDIPFSQVLRNLRNT